MLAIRHTRHPAERAPRRPVQHRLVPQRRPPADLSTRPSATGSGSCRRCRCRPASGTAAAEAARRRPPGAGGRPVATYLRKFLAGDAVLMWDLGGGRTAEDVARVAQASDSSASSTRAGRRRGPVGRVLGATPATWTSSGPHRWPLFTSLEMTKYRDWLAQRKALIPPGQADLDVGAEPPARLVRRTGLRPGRPPTFADPIGPHPEQVRLLAYIAPGVPGAAGSGSGPTGSSPTRHHGRDRLQGMALLNAEIDMLEPVLLRRREARPSGSTPATRT